MKKVMFFSLIALFFAVPTYAADTGLSPSSLKLKVYTFSVSTSPLCTGLSTVVDNGATPVEVEFVGGVNLGSGSIANGSYPCVVIEFDDNIKFTPSSNSTSTNCNSATEYTVDVCRSGTSALPDGSTTTCTVGSNRVAMYLSTGSASAGASDAFNPPTTLGDASHGFTLGAALTVSGASSGKFVVNPAGKVCDDNDASCDGGPGGTGVGSGSCKMEPPAFSFSQI